ncbi:CopG family transcriptional regulator [Pseudarthrobacter sp. PvP090]|uniref:ribbon-helix-helix domain-containing protein n=1 Tax=Pseudarthrobacter sp. PvP090 TaxID=3156393 RepID=UPI00339171D9
MSKGTPNRAIRIDDALWENAKEVAIRRGDTISEILRGALEEYVSAAPAARHISPHADYARAESMSVFEATTTTKVHLNRADMEAHGHTFEPGLSVTAVPMGGKLWHLTAAYEGCVWEGLGSSEEIEATTLLATIKGN